jgi:hypothetical protein
VWPAVHVVCQELRLGSIRVCETEGMGDGRLLKESRRGGVWDAKQRKV